jgi:small neutral amino acid transporter SnatA (MarC family)
LTTTEHYSKKFLFAEYAKYGNLLYRIIDKVGNLPTKGDFMSTSSPVQTFKRSLIILTACLLQLTSAFVFAAPAGANAELHAFKPA